MSHNSHTTLNRQEVERVAHEALGRQLRLLVGLSALLLVLGFVVGQFTGASLARRNTERLQAQLDQVEQELANLENRIGEQRDDHSQLEAALIRIEGQRRSEIEIDLATLEAMIGNVQAVRSAANTDLDVFDAARRTVPTPQVRRLVDRFVSEQVQSLEQLLTTSTRRLELPAQTELATAVNSPSPVTTEQPAGTPLVTGLSVPAVDESSPSQAPVSEKPRDEPTIAERTWEVATPPVCRPRQPILAETDTARAVTAAEERYLAPPRRRGFLFFSPSQPRLMDETRVSESESIPLPPR